MNPGCPYGTVLLKNYTLCGYPCDSGKEPFLNDDSLCVRADCPIGTWEDDGDNSICYKTGVPLVSGFCATGLTEWSGKCYSDCPQQYRENGVTCLKPKVKRRTTTPTCGAFYYFAEDGCYPSSLLSFLVFLALFYIIYNWFLAPFIVSKTYKRVSSSKQQQYYQQQQQQQFIKSGGIALSQPTGVYSLQPMSVSQNSMVSDSYSTPISNLPPQTGAYSGGHSSPHIIADLPPRPLSYVV